MRELIEKINSSNQETYIKSKKNQKKIQDAFDKFRGESAKFWQTGIRIDDKMIKTIGDVINEKGNGHVYTKAMSMIDDLVWDAFGFIDK